MIIGFIILFIIIYFFVIVKQKIITCNKTKLEENVKIEENVELYLDKKLKKVIVNKKILLPTRLSDKKTKEKIVKRLNQTFSYIGDDNYKIYEEKKIINLDINVMNNNLVILDNLSYKNDLLVNSNTKSSKVITLETGLKYDEYKLISKLKSKGYSCK